jgi:hypothetical protein
MANDRLSTSAQGRAQLLFLDQTTLTMAPSSQITLDSFVYDPNRRRGQIGIGLTRGTLRFIGGLSSRRNDGVITTPTATLGIRGSTALVRHLEGRTEAVFISGKRLCLEAGGARHCTSRRGGVLTENGYQGRISDSALAGLLARIDGPVPATLERRGAPAGSRQLDPDRGTFGTDGSKRDQGMFDDRLGTDTGVGLLPEAEDAMTADPEMPSALPDMSMPTPDPAEPLDPGVPLDDDALDLCVELGGDFCPA